MGGLGGGYSSSDDDEYGFGGHGPFSGADVEELLCQVGCRRLAALLEGCSSAGWWLCSNPLCLLLLAPPSTALFSILPSFFAGCQALGRGCRGCAGRAER